ncbi:3'-5' exonuclease [Azohydromonas aeria]|uniref:3'-5' exonuclease n=1 Tax=Azohydromonas aeria TaxID=2590212 RepID=UPI002175436A|nr:3'-5' exonuclease [Azohydromonas aeria]
MKSTVNLLGPLAGPWEKLKKGWLLYHLANDNFRFMFEPPPPDEWVALDCETTGLDRRRDEIISIGAVRIVGSRVLTSERLELIVRPEKRTISSEAVKVHRLREQDVAQGLQPEEAMARLLRFIGSRPLVGYYLEFDVAMLNRVVWPMLGLRLPQPKIEVSALFYEWKNRRLPAHERGNRNVDLSFAAVMGELELPLREAHDAMNDAVMAALAFVKLRRLLSGT